MNEKRSSERGIEEVKRWRKDKRRKRKEPKKSRMKTERVWSECKTRNYGMREVKWVKGKGIRKIE